MDRKELVALLKGLAEKLDKGVLDYTRGEVDVPEHLDVEIEYKEKNQKRKFELEVRWMEGDSQGTKRKKSETDECKELPSALDEIKGELKDIFRDIRMGLEEGKMPAVEDASKMAELNVEFDKYSTDKGWSDKEHLFTEKMSSFEKIVKEGDLESAQKLMVEIRGLKKDCHRTYRWKE